VRERSRRFVRLEGTGFVEEERAGAWEAVGRGAEEESGGGEEGRREGDDGDNEVMVIQGPEWTAGKAEPQRDLLLLRGWESLKGCLPLGGSSVFPHAELDKCSGKPDKSQEPVKNGEEVWIVHW